MIKKNFDNDTCKSLAQSYGQNHNIYIWLFYFLWFLTLNFLFLSSFAQLSCHVFFFVINFTGQNWQLIKSLLVTIMFGVSNRGRFIVCMNLYMRKCWYINAKIMVLQKRWLMWKSCVSCDNLKLLLTVSFWNMPVPY